MDGFHRGPVIVEIVLDPPGHLRLPFTDVEIVDRAVTIAQPSGRQVRVASSDTGTRLRVYGTQFTYVEVPVRDEPAE